MADEGYSVNDRRRVRPSSLIITGQSVADAKRMASSDATLALARGASGAVDPDPLDMRQMRSARIRNQRTGGMAGNMSIALGKPKDLMFYWQDRNLPYDMTKVDEAQKLRALCRVIYQTHPVIASAIDIFTKYPLLGMELQCKDDDLVEFYNTLFFDQLDYEEFLIDIGREYWTVGEAWPLGSFNEELGVWEDDELINPDDVSVMTSPFLRDPRFEIKLPESLREVLQKRQPAHEYAALIRSYPELARFANDPNARMPVSNTLLKQLRFKGDTFNKRGVPLMLRGLRAIMQEEMLNAAQDAIAERLYTPLLLARLGASAQDLGTQNPWIPTDGDLSAFEDALDTALSADFRVLTHHFALQLDSVFGRETMPDFGPDFDRLTDRQLQVFGMSRTLLMGAGSGETYAADALNKDLITQLLTTWQRTLGKFMTDRMLVVAEAQRHWDYEERDGKRYPIMEEVLERDEETGEDRIVQQPKLLVPTIHFKTMNLRDEAQEQAFYQMLAESGVPVSMRTRVRNVPIDLDEEMERKADEEVEVAVAAQEVRKRVHSQLIGKNLPVPADLDADFGAKAMQVGQGSPNDAALPTRDPQLGIDAPTIDTSLAPGPQIEQQPTGAPLVDPSQYGTGGTVVPLPTNQMMKQMSDQPQRPPESDEMRAGMPTAASLSVVPDPEVLDVNGDPIPAEVHGSLIDGPKHIGMRREAARAGLVAEDKPLEPYSRNSKIRRSG